jgi:flagella synthesis protein FlgN
MNISISFEQDAKLVNDLLSVLSREQTSLVSADIDSMEALLEEKGQLLQRINSVVQSRYEALSKLGFEPNETGMTAWIKKQAQPVLAQSWLGFQKTLGQAKEMNRLNGTLINKHFSRNQLFLNQLQGNSASGGVYGPNGHTQSQSYSRATLSA